MRELLARAIRKYFGDFLIKKRLPKKFGGKRLFVVPKADMRAIYPGWNKAAPDLAVIVDRYILSNRADTGTTVWDIGSNQGIFPIIRGYLNYI